jgi:protein TonB
MAGGGVDVRVPSVWVHTEVEPMSFDKSEVSVDLSVFLQVDRPFRKRLVKTMVLSAFVQLLVITSLVLLPYVDVTDQLPKVPVRMVMLAAMPASPPPPPPPPRRVAPNEPESPRQQPSKNPNAAPIDVPNAITPQNGIERASESEFGVEGGIEGGVEGGVEGGIPGGVVGGIVGEIPSAPPPQPPSPPTKPIRIGGQVTAPALIYRVEPRYPDSAAKAHIEGLVILEAAVDTEGRVQSVDVLSSHGPFDQAAIDAVKQWRYSPLVLNGKPFPFILTVSLRFHR